MQIICNIINVFTVTFGQFIASSLNFFQKQKFYWLNLLNSIL